MATKQKEQVQEQEQAQEPRDLKDVEIATGETQSEQKAKETKGSGEKEQKEQAPSYPKWPEVPAAYTQTVRDRGADLIATMAETGLESERAGGAMVLAAIVKGLEEAEKPFEAAGAKAWITKERLGGLLEAALATVPEAPLPKELKVHGDLEILYRRGADSFIRQLAKRVRVDLS